MANPILDLVPEELHSIVLHLVTSRVKAIQSLFAQTQVKDVSQDLTKVKDLFSEMGLIWRELEPAEPIIRALFPQLSWLFDLLDKLVSLESELLIAANKKN